MQDADPENTQIPWAQPRLLSPGEAPLESTSASRMAKAAPEAVLEIPQILLPSCFPARKSDGLECSQFQVTSKDSRVSAFLYI